MSSILALVEIEGYELGDLLSESANSVVYRGRRCEDDLPVVLKFLKEEYPNPRQLLRYREEFAIGKHLQDIDGVVGSYDLVPRGNGFFLVLEDVAALSLRKCTRDCPLDVSTILAVTARVARILGAIHEVGVVHRDINPSNILYNPASGGVWIIDFGISTRVRQEAPALESPSHLEGTLAYISPEQTGRMNRRVDYRTDIYSLGATLYELATGQPPFLADDPLALVHCHTAKRPEAPNIKNPDVPDVLSGIILKLLEKAAENRYNSATGLAWDLDECLRHLRQHGRVLPFELGQRDHQARLQIPQTLYGRSAGRERVCAGFEHACDGQTVVLLLTGQSGVGKTALVQEVHRPMTAHAGIYAAGKCDQLQRSLPYSPIAQAFQQVIAQLLTEPEDRIERWRALILDALGDNAQVVIDVVPTLEHLIGPQPALPELSPQERHNRFKMCFQSFVRVLAQPEHPLVLFIDGLQWVDDASLRLIDHLLNVHDCRSLFFVGAFRDNEVSASHPLAHVLDGLRRAGIEIDEVHLEPLGMQDVNELVADTVQMPREETAGLAELVYQRTGGNPLFVGELLTTLADERMLCFCAERGRWQWDLEALRTRGIAGNVGELMSARIQNLPERPRQVLTLAACVGNQFDLVTLAAVCDSALRDTAIDLKEPIAQGLVIPLSGNHQYHEHDLSAAGHAGSVVYRFAHDRIQQAACALVPEQDRIPLNKRVGMLLLDRFPPNEDDSKVFEIVNHLNTAVELITTPGERLQLAELNYLAGKRARTSAAHEAALAHFEQGVQLLADVGWRRHYDLMLGLCTAAAEAAYLNGRYELLDCLAKDVEVNSRTLLDRLGLFESQVLALGAQAKPMEVVNLVLDVVRMFGKNLPRTGHMAGIALGILKVKLAGLGKPIGSLVDTTALDDPTLAARARILSLSASSAFFCAPRLLPIIVLELARLSLSHGRHPLTPFAYVAHGTILCGALGAIEAGYAFGRVGVAILDKHGDKAHRAKTLYIYNGFVRHWKEPILAGMDDLESGYQDGLAAGDFEYAAWCTFASAFQACWGGVELNRCRLLAQRCAEAGQQLQQATAESFGRLSLQSVLNLQGECDDPLILAGDAFDEHTEIPAFEETNNVTGLIFALYNKQLIHFLLGEYETSLQLAEQVEPLLDHAVGLFASTRTLLWHALTLLALAPDRPPSQRRRMVRKARRIGRRFKKWARHCPVNFRHTYELIEAELQRVSGARWRAAEHYQKAIEWAHESGILHEEALAYELAASHFAASGNENIASIYMHSARYGYIRWGAKAKVDVLDQKWSRLLEGGRARAAVAIKRKARVNATQPSGTSSWSETITGSGTDSDTDSSGLRGDQLDLASVLKASQAISSEIIRERLLPTLTQLAVENAGASRGVLILKSEGVLRVQAEVDTNGAGGGIRAEGAAAENHDGEGAVSARVQDISFRDYTRVAKSVVRYVMRTKENVVLGDAANEAAVFQDRYVAEARPASVLCMPVSRHGETIGALYLENNGATEAFTPERVDTLKVLCAQAAISLESAGLYESLKRQVELLEQRQKEIQELNAELRRQIGSRSEQLFSALALIGRGTTGVMVLKPGSLVNGLYSVVRLLGEGGMGAVHEAVRVTDGRRVALKLATRLGDAALAELAREANIASRVSHPRVVGILDVDVAKEGFLCLVMEYVDGKSLKEYEPCYGHPSPQWGLEVVAQIAEGVAALHEQGIIHRDLKPGNVLITESEGDGAIEVKIADFGISRLKAPYEPDEPNDEGEGPAGGDGGRSNDGTAAAPHDWSRPEVVPPRLAADDSPQQDEGAPWALGDPNISDAAATIRPSSSHRHALAGTPHYMAPDLLDTGGEATTQSDVFSIGVLAFQVLTGGFPFANPPIAARQHDKPLPELRTLVDVRRDLDPAVARVLDRSASYIPAARPTASELAAALKTPRTE